ncbi:MAG: glutamate--tRNA ligase [Patescibacteria group bacterium]
MQNLVRTRMAPSPTGDMHVGSMAILLKNYAYAKKHAGKFILRIEDTDKTREVKGGVKAIQDIINDYGLDWDEGPGKGGKFGPYIQSQRLGLYQKYTQQLLNETKAYHCFCSKERLEELRDKMRAEKKAPKYDRHCLGLSEAEKEEKIKNKEKFVVRLRVPDNKNISFIDLIRGEIAFNSSEIDDQVLLKSDGYPTYHLAVVVDDHLMQISYVMRGEEWISSTPKHVLLYQAFSWQQPKFAHIPIFLNPDGKGKMSKRKGTVSARSFLDRGYLPEALLNFFMILGWTPKDQREILSLEEYVEEFDPRDLNKNSVAFDLKKLDWINGVYIRKLKIENLKLKINKFLPSDFPKDKLGKILVLVRERLVRLDEIEELTNFFYRDIDLDSNLLLKKADQMLVVEQLNKSLKKLENLEAWNLENLEKTIRKLQEENNWHRGQYFMMLRLASLGRKVSPPLFESIEVLGSEITLNRLRQAKDLINDK